MSHFTLSNPLPFPPAILNRVTTRRTNVVCLDGSIANSIVLSSASGAFYEKSVRLKEAIYGEVASGYMLEALSTGELKRTGVMVAIKIIYRDRFELLRSQNCPEDPMNEFACLTYIRDTPTASHPSPPNRYPNLCYFYEACQNDHFIFSIMEFIDGMELYDYLDENGAMLPAEAREVFKQIVTGWSVLHRLGISHRDMSLENVMFQSGDPGRAVIIDFGMARLATILPNSTHTYFPPLGQHGKHQYMAPEVFLSLSPFRGCEADVWGMGIMLFMLIAGHPPCTTATVLDDLYNRICANQLPALIRRWGHPFSAECVHLVNCMLRSDGEHRIRHEALINHPWFAASTP